MCVYMYMKNMHERGTNVCMCVLYMGMRMCGQRTCELADKNMVVCVRAYLEKLTLTCVHLRMYAWYMCVCLHAYDTYMCTFA